MTITANRLALSLEVDIVLGSRGPATCICGRRLPATRGDVFELEHNGQVLCHECARTQCPGEHRASAVLAYILDRRQNGRPDQADDAIATLSAGLDLLAELEAERSL